MDTWLPAVMTWLSLPQHGLGALFVVSFLAATLLPVGSEPVLYGLLRLHPDWFWPALAVATAGNTLGGIANYALGRWAGRAFETAAQRSHDARALRWLRRLGPKALLLAWLPVVGDPLCAVAGWSRLPFWRCVAFIAIGKFARYLVVMAVLTRFFPGTFG